MIGKHEEEDKWEMRKRQRETLGFTCQYTQSHKNKITRYEKKNLALSSFKFLASTDISNIHDCPYWLVWIAPCPPGDVSHRLVVHPTQLMSGLWPNSTSNSLVLEWMTIYNRINHILFYFIFKFWVYTKCFIFFIYCKIIK